MLLLLRIKTRLNLFLKYKQTSHQMNAFRLYKKEKHFCKKRKEENVFLELIF